MRLVTVPVIALALLLFGGRAVVAQDVVSHQTVIKLQAQQSADPNAQGQADLQKAMELAKQHLPLTFSATSGMLGEVVTGAPYSAVTTNESVQTLTDGNRIVQKSSFNVARDGQGRVRREEVNDSGVVTSVMIMDPVAHATYVLDPTTRTARKTALMVGQDYVMVTSQVTKDAAGTVTTTTAGGTSATPLPHAFELKLPPAGTGVYSFGNATFVMSTNMEYRNEPIGTQTIEGLPVDGTRSVGTIPAGQIGNERPIEIVSETWYSKDLKMTVMSHRVDPRNGETNYRVSSIRRGEPDASLFQVPPDFTIK